MPKSNKRPLFFNEEVGIAWIDSTGKKQTFNYFGHKGIRTFLFVETHDGLSTAWIKFKLINTICVDADFNQAKNKGQPNLRDHTIHLELFPTNGKFGAAPEN
jgi:hypothetical protein